MSYILQTSIFELAFFLLAALDLVNLFLSSIETLFCMQDGIEVSVIAKLGWAILLLVSIGAAASMVIAFYKKDSGYYLAYRAFLALRVLASVLFAGYMLFLVVSNEAVDQVEFGKFINNSFCSVSCLTCTGTQHMGRLFLWTAIVAFASVAIYVLSYFAEGDLDVMNERVPDVRVGEQHYNTCWFRQLNTNR